MKNMDTQQTALASLSKAEQALAKANTVGELKKFVSIAEAASQLARTNGLVKEAREYEQAKLKAQRKAGEMLSTLEKNRGGDRKSTRQAVGLISPYREAIEEAGVEEWSAERWQRVASVPDQIFDSYIAKPDELTTAGLLRDFRISQRHVDLKAQQAAIDAGEVVLPEGVFEVISIDPPWPYGNENYDPSGRRASNPYPEMSLDQLADLEIPAAEDCILWLWTTHKFMRHSFELLDGWDFRDVAILTWVKDRMGLGSWLRSQSEFCIMAVRGEPKVILSNQTTVLHGPMREHSRKPDSFYEMVDQLCIGRKLDYFSREKRAGWEQVGNTTDLFNAVA